MKDIGLFFGIFIYADLKADPTAQSFQISIRPYETEEEANERGAAVVGELRENFNFINQSVASINFQMNDDSHLTDETIKEVAKDLVFVFNLKSRRERDSIQEKIAESIDTNSNSLSEEFLDQMICEVVDIFPTDEMTLVKIQNKADPKETILCSSDPTDYDPDYFTFSLAVDETPFKFDETDPECMSKYKELRHAQLYAYYLFKTDSPIAIRQDGADYMKAFNESEGLYRVERYQDGDRFYDIVDETGYQELFS